MVLTLANPACFSKAAGFLVAGKAAVVVSAALASLFLGPALQARAQQAPIHYFNRGGLPPGAIGSQQLLRGGPLPNYFQPVEIEAPEGASISLAVDRQFIEARQGSIKIGALLGQVYFFRVTGIRENQGFEVYPTVEVINRLYPPPGFEARFPIPVQLTQEELELALSGQFVTRIIYLENPNDAFPMKEDPKRQRYFEVHPNDDPLEVADRLGRPMAILRMGSRVPDSSESTDSLGDRGAPMLLYPPAPVEAVPPGKAPAAADPVTPAAFEASLETSAKTNQSRAVFRVEQEPTSKSRGGATLTRRLFSLPGSKQSTAEGQR